MRGILPFMKQLVLTTHTGVNLNYPLPGLTAFVRQHASGTPADHPNLLQKLELIFAPGQADGGFVILGLDDAEDSLIGVLAMESAAATQSGQHRLITLVMHREHRRQGHGHALLRSGKMLTREHILLALPPSHDLAPFFQQAGFEALDDALVLKR